MKIRTSDLDNETIVIEVEKGDTGDVVEMLDSKENGFAIFGEGVDIPMAVVDGRLFIHDWFTADHLIAIEAHELGHIRMQTIDESTAEKEGIRLLKLNNLDDAAELLISRGIA